VCGFLSVGYGGSILSASSSTSSSAMGHYSSNSSITGGSSGGANGGVDKNRVNEGRLFYSKIEETEWLYHLRMILQVTIN
jgi:hypothetical protein